MCGLPSMAGKQELKTSNLTQGSDTCQPQSFNETEDSVETTGLSAVSSIIENEEITSSTDVQNEVLSALPSVENGGLSDSSNLQSEGLSDLSGVENGASSYSADFQSQGLSTLSSFESKGLPDSADLQSKGLSALSTVKNKGQSNCTDVHRKVLSNSCLVESSLMSGAVTSDDENPEPISENMKDKTLAGADCHRQYDLHGETEIADGLTSAVSVASRTKKFESFANSALNKYQSRL